MKIQCDACNKGEATVFCTADEAALCDGCDRRVHHANKLASKHQRFSLHCPSSKQYPLCDVCLERRAFVFCQQDRAILCRECDLPIHSASEHTQKHTRFLLSGVKLSASASAAAAAATAKTTFHSDSSQPPSPNSTSQSSSVVASSKSNVSPPPPATLMASNSKTCPSSTPSNSNSNSTQVPIINNMGGGISLVCNEAAAAAAAAAGFTSSSMFEYLMETLPGWQVEDLLDSPSVPFGFSKNGDDMLPLTEADIDGNIVGSFSPGSMGIWVPQAPSSLYSATQMDQQIGHCRETKEATNTKASRSSARLRDDNFFLVPRIRPANNNSSKRSGFLW